MSEKDCRGCCNYPQWVKAIEEKDILIREHKDSITGRDAVIVQQEKEIAELKKARENSEQTAHAFFDELQKANNKIAELKAKIKELEIPFSMEDALDEVQDEIEAEKRIKDNV
jgi:chromosome segregation ATPase